MLPSRHFILGTLLAIVLLIFPKVELMEALLFIAATVLIDVDHYLYYVLVEKDLSLPKSYHWYRMDHLEWLKLSREEKNKHKGYFYVFHGLETLTLVFLLSIFVHPLFLYVFMGFLFHLLLDIIEMRRHQDRLDKISFIHDYLKFKKLERRFKHPLM